MEGNYTLHFPLQTTKSFLPWMVDNKQVQGHIISIASISGFGGLWGTTDYAAANGAVINFTEALRQELISGGKENITVTCICPYHMETGLFRGFKTKFPYLLPTLKPSVVAYRTVRALVYKEPIVVVPCYMAVFIALKWYVCGIG